MPVTLARAVLCQTANGTAGRVPHDCRGDAARPLEGHPEESKCDDYLSRVSCNGCVTAPPGLSRKLLDTGNMTVTS